MVTVMATKRTQLGLLVLSTLVSSAPRLPLHFPFHCYLHFYIQLVLFLLSVQTAFHLVFTLFYLPLPLPALASSSRFSVIAIPSNVE